MRNACLSITVLLLLAAPALADMSVMMSTTGGGSPYIATVITGPIGPLGPYDVGETFDTFCLENKEWFIPGHVYGVTLAPYAIEGGPEIPEEEPANADNVDIATAWLYSEYLDLNPTVRSYAALEIQHVIWYIEDEVTSLTTQEQNLLNLAVAGGASWGSDFHGVMAMNLSGKPGDFIIAQSQLVRIPAPAALALGAIGLGLVGWLMRRIA